MCQIQKGHILYGLFALCPGKDLNLHGLPRLLLRQVRLPISPPGQIVLVIISQLFINSKTLQIYFLSSAVNS